MILAIRWNLKNSELYMSRLANQQCLEVTNVLSHIIQEKFKEKKSLEEVGFFGVHFWKYEMM